MPSFLHPSLFWILGLPTLGVVLIPVLIHLINMMRHRRVPWAAMEFLRQSQKKNRTWVMLKQLLLLLLRMLAVAGVVLLVAQPLVRNQWGNLLGRSRAHHIVLLDDSFSMSDRWEGGDAFSEAKQVAQRIGAEAARQTHPQLFTLLRFSQVGRLQQAAQPDLLKQPVDAGFSDRLTELLAKISVGQTAADATPALRAVAQLLGEGDGERRVLYLVSDFRQRQWDDPVDPRAELIRLGEAGAEIHLVDCIDRARPNLAVTSLSPAQGIRAAGVPWFMEVAVENFGPSPARNVSISLEEDGHGRPAATLAEIPPGKTATARFQVNFLNPGRHEITAHLETDAVAADNSRYCTFDLPRDLPALLIAGDPESSDARYLSWALAPGGSARTGIQPQIETPRYLSVKPLANFRTISLANVDRLDASAIEALEKYVSSGGGLVFFLGERSQAKYFNDVLYRDGNGLFPAPLTHPADLSIDRLEPAPDVQVTDHPIFRVFAGKRNSFLQKVAVTRYFATPQDWRPASDSTVRVLASLRNGAPLVIERRFGKGRVVAFLTTASPAWNNWAANPSIVVVLQELQAYLSEQNNLADSRLVGSPLQLRLDPAIYQAEVRFTTPAPGDVATIAVNAAPDADGMLTAVLTDTDASGFHEVKLTRADGASEIRRYAMNVEPSEGNLATLDAEQLAARLDGVNYRFDAAAAFQSVQAEQNGQDLSEALLAALVALLIAEQILAWSATYHTSERHMRSEGGVP